MAQLLDVARDGSPPDVLADRSPRTTRLAAGLGALVALLGAVCLASIAYGSRSIEWASVVEAFVAFDPDSTDHLVITTLRVPRTLLGLVVGVALGLAGAAMQGVTRNPLADPGLLGVNAGASMFVVFAITFAGVSSMLGYMWFAFAGAAVASVAVYAIGSLGRDGATPIKLALAGAALTAALQSITTGLLLTNVDTYDRYRFWIVGSLSGRGLDVLYVVLPFIVAGTVLALVSGRLLNAMSLGDDVARALGQKVALARGVSAVSIVLLCGAATAAAGPIAFVGLTVPHIARLLTGPDYRWILPYSAVLAPVLLLVSDVVGRLVVRPGELQVGIVMAVIGAPFFIALVRRRKLAEL